MDLVLEPRKSNDICHHIIQLPVIALWQHNNICGDLGDYFLETNLIYFCFQTRTTHHFLMTYNGLHISVDLAFSLIFCFSFPLVSSWSSTAAMIITLILHNSSPPWNMPWQSLTYPITVEHLAAKIIGKIFFLKHHSYCNFSLVCIFTFDFSNFSLNLFI